MKLSELKNIIREVSDDGGIVNLKGGPMNVRRLKKLTPKDKFLGKDNPYKYSDYKGPFQMGRDQKLGPPDHSISQQLQTTNKQTGYKPVDGRGFRKKLDKMKKPSISTTFPKTVGVRAHGPRK